MSLEQLYTRAEALNTEAEKRLKATAHLSKLEEPPQRCGKVSDRALRYAEPRGNP